MLIMYKKIVLSLFELHRHAWFHVRMCSTFGSETTGKTEKKDFAKIACVHDTHNYKQSPYNSLEFQNNT
jgi:hypothetical protein